LLAAALGDPFDLLDLLDFETGLGSMRGFDEEGYEDRPLGVCVDAAACAAFEGGEEEGCAS
jgi:hypothetical protein